MLDHVSVPVSDFARATSFYDAVLGTLGWVRIKERVGAVGYGPPGRHAPAFWILQRMEPGGATAGFGLHISFEAKDRPSVDAFFETALGQGARNAGRPGVRSEYTQPFYGAFVIDLDGFKIEAVCRSEP
ncbi:MAG: VOC family protein [Proteobacteria bacterium]|nr:VOC family protein [Pseudomonadota bacterium]